MGGNGKAGGKADTGGPRVNTTPVRTHCSVREVAGPSRKRINGGGSQACSFERNGRVRASSKRENIDGGEQESRTGTSRRNNFSGRRIWGRETSLGRSRIQHLNVRLSRTSHRPLLLSANSGNDLSYCRVLRGLVIFCHRQPRGSAGLRIRLCQGQRVCCPHALRTQPLVQREIPRP